MKDRRSLLTKIINESQIVTKEPSQSGYNL